MKKRHHVKKTAFLTEQVSAIIEQKTPPKYKDPGCPTISCNIGTHKIDQALLDLGASVNLMPYSVYLQMGLKEIKPTSIMLQLADRSVKKPRGIVEDVLIQIDKFYYPVDFLILDTDAVVHKELKIPIILGRPFLATANALINCRNGLMKISFGNMTQEINIFNVAKQSHDDEGFQTFMINTLEEVQSQRTLNPIKGSFKDSKSSDHLEISENFTTFKDSKRRGSKFRKSRCKRSRYHMKNPKPSTEETKMMKLAQLPKGPKHVLNLGRSSP